MLKFVDTLPEIEDRTARQTRLLVRLQEQYTRKVEAAWRRARVAPTIPGFGQAVLDQLAAMQRVMERVEDNLRYLVSLRQSSLIPAC